MYRCTTCTHTVSKWQGKCPECNAWNSLEEIPDTPRSTGGKKSSEGTARETVRIIDTVHGSSVVSRVEFGSRELSTVFGGGIVSGSLSLLSGEPGIGKSTLALQMADWYAIEGREVLYVSAEETTTQISDRARRLGIANPHIALISCSRVEDILETIDGHPADLVILDSVSMLRSDTLGGSAGSMGQIRGTTEILMETAKRTNRAIVLIGHVTKDGTIAGPKALEHLVDVVLSFEGVRYEDYRILRALKNRFGPTDEVGLFRMTEKGLMDMPNPGLEFISAGSQNTSGSALGVTIEGTRPIIVEIEALATYTKFGYPKRSARGIPTGKLDILLAVLTRFTDTKMDTYDVYANISRGLSIAEPWVDLATVAAIIGSRRSVGLHGMVWIGEVSLTGIVRSVHAIGRRVEEAVRLGMTRVIVPAGSLTPETRTGSAQVVEVRTIRDVVTEIARHAPEKKGNKQTEEDEDVG